MILYDGHDITELFMCGTPEFKILNSETEYYDTNGRDGAVLARRKWGMSTVEFPIAILGNSTDRRDAFSTLGAWLNVDGPRALVFPDTPERYYLAVPSGELSLERGVDNDIAKLSFDIVEPVAYGVERTVTVPSAGSVTFMVDGTYPTKPTITASASVRDSSSPYTWGLELDDGDYIQLLTGDGNSHVLAIDCEKRTSTMDGNVLLPTLQSDWFAFAPGEHKLEMIHGTGAATITYRERWL